jgi:tetratricopeptide (TPR) repeat protein
LDYPNFDQAAKAFEIVKTQNPEILNSIHPNFRKHDDYWQNLGMVHFKIKNYTTAITCFKKGKTTSSNPELYLASGICYEKQAEFPNAVQEFKQLVLFKPSKFLYRYLLMKAYLKNKDLSNAKSTAQGIINLKPKIPSQKVQYYKMMAKKVINSKD